MNASIHEGGCQCGDVRYTVSGKARTRCNCHCESCRRASGAPFVAWATFPVDACRIVQGELKFHASSSKVRRGFCATCGTALTYRHDARSGEVDIAVATLDDPTAYPPEYHIWISDKLPWVEPGDGLPQYPEWKSSEG